MASKLLRRLTIPGAGEEKIDLHAFFACLRLWEDGTTGFNKASISALFGLDTNEQNHLDAFIDKVLTEQAYTSHHAEDIVMCGEKGIVTEAQMENLLGF
jgi:hypothetical protein